ncbi:SDR family NAD(P)-dependent oxidoreductase [Mycobacterium bourgelatii]|uniref:Short-chain dehydrogenase n=1 Tax=Mycobacterium bourgelatii TaxID=1273442 RepID=A0A7I9YL49_MYCBU|nr:SDR family oxidoreductase [Mycobacterium bourgelatii]MCV6975670.1 SDR family oxidoreductase [Mycobacterium bourgelatii]GFG89348.1 short-chain dehydrogenase [Mycobacterium bourgelatii]
MTLTGMTTLVTGSGAGVGRGIALALASQGAHVIVATRTETGLAVTAEIVSRGGAATFACCDVTDGAAVADAVELAVATTGRLDAVVHNATSNLSSQPHQLADVDRELWDSHFSVSVRGAYHCAVAAFAALKERGGTLLVMTSPAGIEGSATLPLYATMKGALRGFAKSLAREWAPYHITVNAVSPLAFSPAMTAAIKADPEMEDRLARRIPLGRIGDPERDVGSAVAFLVSPAARYVTGQTLGVDGGHYTNL